MKKNIILLLGPAFIASAVAQSNTDSLLNAWGDLGSESQVPAANLDGSWSEQLAAPSAELVAQVDGIIDEGLRSKLSLGNVDLQVTEPGKAKVVLTLPAGEIETSIRNASNELSVFARNIGVEEAESGKNIPIADAGSPVDGYRIIPGEGGARVVFDLRTAVAQQSYGQNGALVLELEAKDPEFLAEANASAPAADLGDSNAENYQNAQAIPEATAQLAANPDRITLSLQDVNIRQLLQIFADQRGINIVVADDVQGNVSVELNDVPWEQALDVVLESKGLGKKEQGNVIYIAPQAKFDAEIEAETKRIEDQKALELARQTELQTLELERLKLLNETQPAPKTPEEEAKAELYSKPLVTKVVRLNYASAMGFLEGVIEDDDADNAESSFMSERGSIIADQRTNSLIIEDVPDKVERLLSVLKELDVPSEQVMIDARVVLARDDFSKAIGATWGLSAGARRIGGTNATLAQNIGVGQLAQPGTLLPEVGRYGATVLSSAFNVSLELNALHAEGRGETLSNPRVITTNNQQAVIRQGEEIPYQTVSDKGTKTEFRPAVLELLVTPRITPSRRVILDLAVRKDERGQDSPDGIAINKREVETQVIVDNGNTVVLGGVFEKVTSQTINKVPFLGDIPAVGQLFRRNQNIDTKFELLIFVTPTILE